MFPLLLLRIVGQRFSHHKQREEHKASSLKTAMGLSNRIERVPVWKYHEKHHCHIRTPVGIGCEDLPPTRVAMEAGVHSIWISEQMQELGHEVIVANVRELWLVTPEVVEEPLSTR